VENHSWRWIFYINLPLSVLALALLYTRVPESRDETRAMRPDWLGSVLASTALGCLVFSLIEYPRLGLGHPAVWGLFTTGIGLSVLFVRVEHRSASPMLPLELFKLRVFSGINIATLLLYTGLNGLMFFLPFNLIHVQGYTPLQTGLIFVPMSLLIFFMSRWAGGLASRNPGIPLVIGPLTVAAAFLILALPGTHGGYWLTFFPGVLLIGIGMGLCIAPITEVAMGAVPTRQSGIASGVNNAVARLASVLAVALFGVVVSLSYNRSLDAELSRLDISPRIGEYFQTERTKLAAATPPPALEMELEAQLDEAIKRSFVSGFRALCIGAAGLALATTVCCWVTLRARGPALEREPP
jgi:predicted MFS family arabinose efflux permease